MPHVVIKCYKGRTKEQLQEIANKVANSTAEAFGTNVEKISVSVETVEPEEWSKIYKEEILGKPDTLYVEPNYKVK